MDQSVSHQIISLLTTHHLLTAPQIVSYLNTADQSVNKTSVYRALEKLEAQALICKQNLQDNDLVYELRENHHDHLVCTKCGKVTTAACQVKIDQSTDFAVDHHHLTVFGLCSACRHSTSSEELA